jgi:hypothetical protein
MATTLAALQQTSERAVVENFFSDQDTSGFSQLQLRPLLVALFARFRRCFMIGLHGRPKKGESRMLRNWYLTT